MSERGLRDETLAGYKIISQDITDLQIIPRHIKTETEGDRHKVLRLIRDNMDLHISEMRKQSKQNNNLRADCHEKAIENLFVIYEYISGGIIRD